MDSLIKTMLYPRRSCMVPTLAPHEVRGNIRRVSPMDFNLADGYDYSLESDMHKANMMRAKQEAYQKFITEVIRAFVERGELTTRDIMQIGECVKSTAQKMVRTLLSDGVIYMTHITGNCRRYALVRRAEDASVQH
jgi:hypothetical protein